MDTEVWKAHAVATNWLLGAPDSAGQSRALLRPGPAQHPLLGAEAVCWWWQEHVFLSQRAQDTDLGPSPASCVDLDEAVILQAFASSSLKWGSSSLASQVCMAPGQT